MVFVPLLGMVASHFEDNFRKISNYGEIWHLTTSDNNVHLSEKYDLKVSQKNSDGFSNVFIQFSLKSRGFGIEGALSKAPSQQVVENSKS